MRKDLLHTLAWNHDLFHGLPLLHLGHLIKSSLFAYFVICSYLRHTAGGECFKWEWSCMGLLGMYVGHDLYSLHNDIYSQNKSHAWLRWRWKKFYNFSPGLSEMILIYALISLGVSNVARNFLRTTVKNLL